MLKMLGRLKKEEEGQVLVAAAMMMTLFLSIGAFVLDYGLVTLQKVQLQNAADAAALAGAQSVDMITDSALDTLIYEYADANVENSLFKSELTVQKTYVSKATKTLSVKVSQKVETLFGGLFATDSLISADATAKLTRVWNGEALPFINYVKAPELNSINTLWDHVEVGLADRIEKKECSIVTDPATGKIYFTVNYSDGIDLQNGVDSQIKTDLNTILAQGRTQYIFSLSPEAITTSKYNLDNNTHVDFNDLVLMKVEIITYEDNGDDRNMSFRVLGLYDIVNEIYPETDFFTSRFEVRLTE
ncbi:pilus assembly protein TadG-related protein [Youngiibacter multivorans]|uniref:Flp pilus assembly protein TadG n=1 Tax=Youngiibacter multivorans TaxID=937251 RepID=A0ABS4G5L8_9CLOT|nr:pilus assembly protein TadG-related protein [Youngiibacter multivorans]MBP1919834.1 Flp pilus assembly protein TadG [Youngiibacter multivorans]